MAAHLRHPGAAAKARCALAARLRFCQNPDVGRLLFTGGLLLLTAAGGCTGSHPFVASGDAKSVQVNYSGDAAAAVPLAQRHCGGYGRAARLDYSGDGIAVFDCVGP